MDMELDKSLPTDNYSAWIQNLESASARARADRDEMLVKSLAEYGLTISTEAINRGTYTTPDGVWISIDHNSEPLKLYIAPRWNTGQPPDGCFDPDAFPSADDFVKHSAMLHKQIVLAKSHIDTLAARREKLAEPSKYPAPQIAYSPDDTRFDRWIFGGACVIAVCIIALAVIRILVILA